MAILNPPPPLNDQVQTRLALAALFVALVRTLHGSDAAVLPKAEAELERLYYKMKDWSRDTNGALETLRMAQQMLRDP